MPFQFSKYSGLLLVFFIHGLVYACLLWRKGIRNERSSDQWLAFFLLLCILYISPWMLGFAGWYEGDRCLECRNFLFYMPFQHTLVMGPVIYFYVQSLLNPSFTFQPKHRWHFLPGLLYIVWSFIVAVTDGLVLKRYYLMDGISDPDFDVWYVLAGLVSLITYLYISIRYYNGYRQFIVQELSFADNVTFRWVRNFLVACIIYFLSSLLVAVLPLAGVEVDYIGAWWYYLFFAILFYYIAISGYSNAIENRVQFELDFLRYRQPLQLQASPQETLDATYEVVDAEEKLPAAAVGNAAGGDGLYELWKEKVLAAVVTRREYRNPELTLTGLAKMVGTNPSLLSRVINQQFGMNFNDFINQQRVEEIKQQLQNPANAHLTIMSLAYDAGFNSKATFNRAFKKFTSKNPKDFTDRSE